MFFFNFYFTLDWSACVCAYLVKGDHLNNGSKKKQSKRWFKINRIYEVHTVFVWSIFMCNSVCVKPLRRFNVVSVFLLFFYVLQTSRHDYLLLTAISSAWMLPWQLFFFTLFYFCLPCVCLNFGNDVNFYLCILLFLLLWVCRFFFFKDANIKTESEYMKIKKRRRRFVSFRSVWKFLSVSWHSCINNIIFLIPKIGLYS